MHIPLPKQVRDRLCEKNYHARFLSWTVLNLHEPAQQYTPKQDSILAYLNTQLDSGGGYLMPNLAKNASKVDRKKFQEDAMNKPWAQIACHKSYNAGMGVNIAKALITDIIIVLFFCWIISGFTANSFGKTFLAALLTALIISLYSNYVIHIWYQAFDLEANVTDNLVSWGITASGLAGG
ncbi:hypothetical protein [Parafilimonas sp.]|uniref:hypothetical protein n=1 Tax=Parafilimonas sp. TaxID=1969739 RepID=UPI0039E38CF9